jgi:hypothetical protein
MDDHPGIPTVFGTQFHHERLRKVGELPGRVSLSQERVAALEKALRSIKIFPDAYVASLMSTRLGRWRLTECGDNYPAHVNDGAILHTATDAELERLQTAGFQLYEGAVGNAEGPHWALKTAAQIASGVPPAAQLAFTGTITL